ncbi:MAG: glycosyltransferase family 2 protein, partial [Bacteroidota bacterium]
MFSILIPTYNYSAVLLVKTLQKQLLNQEIPFEIICFDNGSNGEANSDNEKINRLEFCRFKALKKD